jgi:peroxygenase
MPRPALPTANIATSDTHPFGSTEDGWAEKVKHQTVLEQHVNYWDRDNDGVIWPMDTFRGFRELGCVAMSFSSRMTVLRRG